MTGMNNKEDTTEQLANAIRNERLKDLGYKMKNLDDTLRLNNNGHEQILRELYEAKDVHSHTVSGLFCALKDDGIKDHEVRRGRVLSLLNELITDLPTA